MAKVKESYPEIEDIKGDLSSLKANTVELARHVQTDGAKQAAVLTEKAMHAVDGLKAQGADQFKKLEQHVKEKPAQSLALAFAAGLLASFLLRRR